MYLGKNKKLKHWIVGYNMYKCNIYFRYKLQNIIVASRRLVHGTIWK